MSKIFELLAGLDESALLLVEQKVSAITDVEQFVRGEPVTLTQKELTREYVNNYRYGGVYIDTINGTQLCPWDYYIAKLPCGNHIIVPPEIYESYMNRKER